MPGQEGVKIRRNRGPDHHTRLSGGTEHFGSLELDNGDALPGRRLGWPERRS